MKELLPLIVLVEDDPNDQELARIALKKTEVPHRLVLLSDGAEAIAWLDNAVLIGDLPHLILLDLKMPKVTGIQVIERIRSTSTTQYLPIVTFTSSIEEGDLKKCCELYVNAYARKPTDFTEYKTTMSDVVRFWLLRSMNTNLIYKGTSRNG